MPPHSTAQPIPELMGELPPAPVELAARLLPFLKDQRSVWGTFTAW